MSRILWVSLKAPSDQRRDSRADQGVSPVGRTSG